METPKDMGPVAVEEAAASPNILQLLVRRDSPVVLRNATSSWGTGPFLEVIRFDVHSGDVTSVSHLLHRSQGSSRAGWWTVLNA